MSKVITATEVKRHNTANSIWIVIKNEVYDVTAYLHEHPGGEEPLLEAAGLDATRAFEDVGHSADARSLLQKFKIGTLAPGECCCTSSTNRCLNDEKPWRSFDKPKSRSTTPKQSKTSLPKSRFKSPFKKSATKKTQSSKKHRGNSALLPKSSNISTDSRIPVPRVQSIVVPRAEKSSASPIPRCGYCTNYTRPPARAAAQPASGGKWKWALLALAAAIVIGVAYKKYAS